MSDTMTASNAATVQAIYEAFGRGDIHAILQRLAADVRWDHWPHGNGAQDAGVPWMVQRTGRNEVAGFFAGLADLEFHHFRPVTVLEGDGRVAALIEVEATGKATGNRLHDLEIHLWEFDEHGLVTSFRHHVDTAKHVAAAS